MRGEADFVTVGCLGCAHTRTHGLHLLRVINFEIQLLGLGQIIVMVFLHLLFNHLELLEFVKIGQLLLISLDSFIEPVDLNFLLPMDVDVSLGVVEVLCVDVLVAGVLLLSHYRCTLICRGLLLFLLGL